MAKRLIVVLGIAVLSGIALRAAGQFVSVGSMNAARSSFQLVALDNGAALAIGATPFDRRVEVYNPASGTFSLTGSLISGRSNPAAVRLESGKVLVSGGHNLTFSATASAEIYD